MSSIVEFYGGITAMVIGCLGTYFVSLYLFLLAVAGFILFDHAMRRHKKEMKNDQDSRI